MKDIFFRNDDDSIISSKSAPKSCLKQWKCETLLPCICPLRTLHGRSWYCFWGDCELLNIEFHPLHILSIAQSISGSQDDNSTRIQHRLLNQGNSISNTECVIFLFITFDIRLPFVRLAPEWLIIKLVTLLSSEVYNWLGTFLNNGDRMRKQNSK